MLGAATTFNALLQELQQIWIDIGETEAEKDRMLIELEIECLEVYRRKVDEAANAKACLHQSVAAKEAELATLLASLGDLTIHSAINVEKKASSLKGQLMIVTPLVEDLKLKKEERIKQFADIKGQVEIINGEILGYSQITKTVNLEEQDLSARKLSEYQSHLRSLQKEKSQRISKVLAYVNEVHLLCSILGLDFGKTVSAVHPSLHDTSLERATNISDITLEGLENAILKLKTERKVRFQKLKDIVTSLYDLWNIMDTTREEKRNFSRITSVIRLTEAEMVEPGALSTETIQQATQEVERLNKLKASRMKELVMKRRAELEEICFKMHMEPDPNTAIDKSNAMIDSGLVDPGELLANIEAQISKVSKEALSRKEIMDRIDRWLSACEEENWLEDYNLDSTRFSGGRSAHINLKRAERARITIKKIPAIVDNLICKTVTWEDDKKQPFLYDGARLVKILEEYKLSRLQKEEEKKLLKDQKKIRNLLLNEKESMYGSKPSPRRSSSFRKSTNTTMTPMPRRNSLTSPTPDLMTPRSYSGRHNGYFKVGLSKRTGWTGPTDKTDRTGPDRTGPTTFGPVLGLSFLANSVLGPVGPVRTDQKPEKTCQILPNWTGPTEDRPDRTGPRPDRPHSVRSRSMVFPVLGLRSGPVLVGPVRFLDRDHPYFKEFRKLSTGPLNFVSIPKEDTISYSSIFSSEPESPPQS